MTAAAGDAHPFPIYGGRYRFGFSLFDADGDPVTGATSPDSERSIDFATFADCTNEAVEIATGSGVYYIDLIYTEMQSSCTMVQIKSGTAKTAVHALYPVRLPVLRSFGALAGSATTITLDAGASAKDGAYVGLYVQCTNGSPANVQGQTRKIISYVGSTKVATVDAAWGTNPSIVTTADLLIPMTVNVHAWAGKEPAEWSTAGTPKVDVAVIATGAITSASFFAGAINGAAIADNAIDANTLSSNTITAGKFAAGSLTASNFAAGAITSTVLASGAITSTVLAADCITAAKLAPDVTTELQSGLATASAQSSMASAITTIDGIVDAILVNTGTDIPAALDALPTAVENAAAMAASVIEGSITLTQAQRAMLSALASICSGMATTTAVFRDTGDTKDRITATVDASGNRSAVTLDLT